jgi:hypothetical protein
MTLFSFDFDDTLCHTPDQHEGKRQWEKTTGLTWPYGGWWGKAESLDTEVFYIPKNEWVYQKYLDAVSEEESYVIMATGRLQKVPGMRANVDKILNQHNLSFDEIHLNWGGDTFRFKTTLFEQLIKKTKCDHFVMYDDRHEHIVKFIEWARSQSCDVTIVDVKNKTTRTIKN